MGIQTMHARTLLMFLILMPTYFCFLAEDATAALACYNCHGTNSTRDIRPEDALFRNTSSGGFQGNHRTHVGEGAEAAACSKCHPGSTAYTSSHRDGMIKISANINMSPQNAVYKDTTSAFPQISINTLGTCTSINCHFEKITPQWGSAALTATGDSTSTGDCTVCHFAPPYNGKHEGKHRQYYGNGTIVCSKCHPDHRVEAKPFAQPPVPASVRSPFDLLQLPIPAGTTWAAR